MIGLALVALGSVAGSVTAFADTVIEDIRDQYTQCRELRTDNSGRRQFFGVYFDLEGQSGPDWMNTRPDGGLVLEEAELFGHSETTRFAIMTINSPSGDWSKYTEQCFRDDGSLAFVYGELRTVHGNVRVEDRLYFDPSGRQVRAIRRLFDLNSGKQLPDDNKNFADQETRFYLRVNMLETELSGD